MSDPTKDRLASAKGRIGVMTRAAPDLMEGFAKVSKVATSHGRFSSAQKELIAVAVSVVLGCEDCIHYHIDGAKRHGATEDDLVEALTVAVEMGGGPALMYAGKALEAFRDL